MKQVLIVAGGPIQNEQLQVELSAQPDLIIAADRGGDYLLELGVRPNVLIGDFDSISKTTLQKMGHHGVEVRSYPTNKDQTDLELAVDLALQSSASQIRILGALGDRMDHTFANVGLLLKTLGNKSEAHLLDQKHDIMLIDRRVIIPRKLGWSISLIPLTVRVTGVTTKGLAYPLDGAVLNQKSTRGIHNEFISEQAIIEINRGRLLIICFCEN